MRIALYHNLTSGGSKREAYEFARQFMQCGHTVDLYHPSTANEQFLPLKSIVQRESVFDLRLVRDLPLRFPGLTRYADFVGLVVNLSRLKRLAKKISKAIDAGGYDFVLLHHDAIVQSPYLLRFLNTRSAYYCNEPMREFYEPSIWRPYNEPATMLDRAQRSWYAPTRWLRQVLVRSEDRHNVCCATKVLANSFFSAESIYRAYGLRASVSYLGVDAEKFRPLDLPREDFVLSVGAVSPLKGYDFLIQALGHLPEARRPRLTIIGNTASTREVNFLRNLARQTAVTLELLVNVSDDTLVQLYNRARALVYSPILEPFGFAPLEALACGTPVIAVKEGGVRESVADGVSGFLVPRDAREFAQVLERVLCDGRLDRTFGENGRAEILRFWTWNHAYKRLLENAKTF